MAKKQNMTQVFNENWKNHYGDCCHARPGSAVQIKTKEKDGYREAVVFGFGQKKKEKNVHKTQRKLGNFAYTKNTGPPRKNGEAKAELGSNIDVSVLKRVDLLWK